MKFMILLKADRNTEAGKMPSEKMLADMLESNERLVKASVMERLGRQVAENAKR
jgi:hypothetical protein